MAIESNSNGNQPKDDEQQKLENGESSRLTNSHPTPETVPVEKTNDQGTAASETNNGDNGEGDNKEGDEDNEQDETQPSVISPKGPKSESEHLPRVVAENADARSERDEDDDSMDASLVQLTEADESRKKLLAACQQDGPTLFDKEFSLRRFHEIVRFQTGTYSEVFRAIDTDIHKLVVFKVIRSIAQQAKETYPDLNFRGSETYKDIFREVIITQVLSRFHQPSQQNCAHCFPKMINAKLVKGEIPAYFLVNKDTSEDDDSEAERLSPIRKEDPYKEYPRAPHEFTVMEFKYYGKPLAELLEDSKITVNQLISVVNQMTIGLAIAEHVYEFEHRDLHISNILIKDTKKTVLSYCLNETAYQIDSYLVKAIIIDSTFSRLKVDGTVFYKDISKTLQRFKGRAPLKENLQDKAYRSMVKDNKDWFKWNPKSNIYWLQYLIRKILKKPMVKEARSDVREYFRGLEKRMDEAEKVEDCVSYITENS